jgi:hypothetical protein
LIRKANNNTKLCDFTFIFCVAAYVCSITGFTLWEKGCLDYIYLKPLFVFDLKDLYGNCATVLLFIFIHKNLGNLKGLIRKKTE